MAGWGLVENIELARLAELWLGESGRRAEVAPELASGLARVVEPALRGRGAIRLLLVPDAETSTPDALAELLVTVSRALGALVPQTRSNDLVVRIQDEGADYRSPHVRGHQTGAELAFHSDRCDLNLLLYVRTAAAGGELSVVGYAEAADAFAGRAPDLAPGLFEPFPFDARDDRIRKDQPWYERPILWRAGRGIRGHYIRRFITDSQRYPDCPRLTSAQTAVLDAFDACLDDLRVGRTQRPEPGELLVMDSYRVAHARRGFTDLAGMGGRLAFRTWVAPSFSERLPDFMLPLSGATAAGSFRGGAGSGKRYLDCLGLPANLAAARWAI